MRRTLTLLRTKTINNTSPLTYSRFNKVQSQDPSTIDAAAPLAGVTPDNFEYYKSLRIYQNHSWLELGNLLLMTTMCSNGFFVDNCQKIYELSRKVFGSHVTNYTIATTIGRIFTAGNTVETMDKFIREWKYPHVNLLVGYSNEIAPGQPAHVKDLDESTRIYAETVDLAMRDRALHEHNGIGVKCSCLIEPAIFKKANDAQLRMRAVFSSGFDNLDQTMTVKQISDKLKEANIDFTPQDLQEYISTFVSKNVTADNMDDVKVTKFEWIRDIHQYYIENTQKNFNKIQRQLTQLTDHELAELEAYNQRLIIVYDRAAKYKCPVLIDAEQSYYQETIDSFAFQHMSMYNKGDRAFLLNTYQNYLKITKDKLDFEIRRCKEASQPLGAKCVRGAYMVEERALAAEYGYESPVHETLEDTHNNYNTNIETIMKNWLPGSHLVVASHNETTVNLAKDLVRKYNIGTDQNKGMITFGQLLGFGDHMTFSLANQGFPVAKYVAFGPVPILIPFFVRRAQETKQMFQSTGLQRSLVFNEIMRRVPLGRKEKF